MPELFDLTIYDSRMVYSMAILIEISLTYYLKFAINALYCSFLVERNVPILIINGTPVCKGSCGVSVCYHFGVLLIRISNEGCLMFS